MRLTEILTRDRVQLANPSDGIRTKPDVLELLARMLAFGAGENAAQIGRALEAREVLGSTGIGDSVAIPHGFVDTLDRRTAALFLCPDGVDFAAADGRPASIFVGLVGPRRESGEHLRTLAAITRLLRSEAFRQKLLASPDAATAFRAIAQEEEAVP